MLHNPHQGPQHPRLTRRAALQAGSVGLLGLGIGELSCLREAAAAPKAKSVIFIFLSGGLGQHDSFDMKPDAPDEIRGEFRPIDTRTPGIRICEHLPRLAQRSPHWALVRSLTHGSNEHSAGHHIMLTGRSQMPIGFNPSRPRAEDFAAIAAVATAATRSRNNLPPAVVLPEKLVHSTGRIIPGQFAAAAGTRYEPWFIEASAFDPMGYGAFPEYDFDHQLRDRTPKRTRFIAPSLELPQGVGQGRMGDRVSLLKMVDRQRADLENAGEVRNLDRYRQSALSLLTDATVRKALDVQSDTRALEKYGNNSFGWSLLMARRLVHAGVNLVQVNLGNDETWDTHGNMFPHLKDKLFPPTDRALSALIDDLHETGQLEDTLVVMAGEFGRTPKISHLPQYYKYPGRDHWGAVQTVFFAGGGVRGGQVIGETDNMGGYPVADACTPEEFGATIYRALGIPSEYHYQDDLGRPHPVYHGEPIRGLLG